MTNLAYMVREDWAQHGTGMEAGSTKIREWLGGPPQVCWVHDVKKFNDRGRIADVEVVRFLSGGAGRPAVANIKEMPAEARRGELDVPMAVVHPDPDDSDAFSRAMRTEAFPKVFVMVWSPTDAVRDWLDGHGAVDLHTGQVASRPDAAMLEAARMMVNEQYNGLSSGIGKSVVIGLLRAFRAEGYPLDVHAWRRVFFAAGGAFRHAEAIDKFIQEMKRGTNHRIERRLVPNIVEVLRERATR